MVTNLILVNLINFIFGFIEFILGLRLILRFFSAGAAPIVQWIYATSNPLVFPFRGMFPDPVLKGGYVLEINTLLALLIYALVGYVIGEMIAFLQFHSTRYYRSGNRQTVEEVHTRKTR